MTLWFLLLVLLKYHIYLLLWWPIPASNIWNHLWIMVNIHFNVVHFVEEFHIYVKQIYLFVILFFLCFYMLLWSFYVCLVECFGWISSSSIWKNLKSDRGDFRPQEDQALKNLSPKNSERLSIPIDEQITTQKHKKCGNSRQ